MYYRGSSSYEDAVKRQLTGIEATNAANTRAINKMDSGLRSAIQESNDITKAGFGATLAMEAEIGNAMVAGFDATNNAIQDMAFGLNSAIRENTYTVVASQAMLTQTFAHGFNAVNNTLNLGFSMISSGLNAMTDRICSKLDEIHDILNNPLLTASRELYRRALDNYNRGYYEEALEDCTKAVEKNKTDFISWYLLGHIYLFGAGKFSNVIDVNKAEEAFFNAAKYIDYDLGKSAEANTLGSEIYYYLGYARLTKSNDLLVETKNAESVKKLEEAEKASREASRLSAENLLAVYEQAKALHFLDRDDEALQLIEKLIRTDKNYAVRASNDKNFESLWDRITALITVLRDELADKLAQGFGAIRALGRKGNEFLADMQFPDEGQVREFEQFYNSELIHGETDTFLIKIICKDFDSLANNVYSKIYESVTNSGTVIKNVRNERTSWTDEFNKVESDIEQKIGHLEAALKKENDYFSVLNKYNNFCGRDDNSLVYKLISKIYKPLKTFDKKRGKFKDNVKIMQSYLKAQKKWLENKEIFRKKHADELVDECNAICEPWKGRIEKLRQQLAKIDFDEKQALEDELDTMTLRLKEVFEYFGNLQGEDYYSIVKKRKKLEQDNFLQNPSSYFEWSLSELEKKLKA